MHQPQRKKDKNPPATQKPTSPITSPITSHKADSVGKRKKKENKKVRSGKDKKSLRAKARPTAKQPPTVPPQSPHSPHSPLPSTGPTLSPLGPLPRPPSDRTPRFRPHPHFSPPPQQDNRVHTSKLHTPHPRSPSIHPLQPPTLQPYNYKDQRVSATRWSSHPTLGSLHPVNLFILNSLLPQPTLFTLYTPLTPPYSQ